MRPEMENGPRPVSARPLPRAWARGPAADDRAAESARRGAPRAPSWASSGPCCCRPLPAVDLHEARSDGRPRISREQNFGRRRVPNPSAISFLLPLLSREERWRRFRPARGRRRRCRGCLAGARRSPSERAAVEVAVGGALPCSCGRDPLQRESSGNAALGFCRPRRAAARSSCAPPRPGSCARDGGRRAHRRRD